MPCSPEKCYRLSSGEHLWDFGNGSAGPVANGQLNVGRDVEFLPNGNLLVAGYYGDGYDPIRKIKGTGNKGHLTEISAANGALVRSHLMGTNTGHTWDGEISFPMRARFLGDELYVSSHKGDGQVGRFAYTDKGEFNYIKTYNKDPRSTAGDILPAGLALSPDGKQLIIAANGPGNIVGVGLGDHDIKWLCGRMVWDDRQDSKSIPGHFKEIYDLILLGNDLLVADYGNKRVQIVPLGGMVSIPYEPFEIPEGYQVTDICLKAGKFDLESANLAIPIDEIGTISPITLLLEKE